MKRWKTTRIFYYLLYSYYCWSPQTNISAFGQTTNSSSHFDIPRSKSVLTKNETSLSNLHGKYTANEINEIISHLYDDLRSDRMIDHNLHHNIAILLFICGDKRNEIAVPACDISTEIPIDWNEFSLTTWYILNWSVFLICCAEYKIKMCVLYHC
jgi:hypothetical protein